MIESYEELYRLKRHILLICLFHEMGIARQYGYQRRTICPF